MVKSSLSRSLVSLVGLRRDRQVLCCTNRSCPNFVCNGMSSLLGSVLTISIRGSSAFMDTVFLAF